MKSISGALALLFILFALSSILAQEWEEMPEAMKAAQQAKKDASRDVNEVKWVLIGCSSLLIGVNHANSAEIPPPNPERLLGKSMEYIEVYDRAYYKQVRALRRKYSIIGCISGGIIYTYAVVQGVSYIEGSSSEANSCCSGGAGEDTKMVWEIFSGCCISGK